MNSKEINDETVDALAKTLVLDDDLLSQNIDSRNLQKSLGLKQYSDPGYYGEISILGKGGGGIVLEGFDFNLGRKVAIKILQQKKCNSPESLERFLREARATAQLEHPNIVPIHHIGVDSTWGLYFTMKKLEGEDLDLILSKLKAGDEKYLEKYTLSNLLNIFADVCNGVAYAHSKGIMHRDLKPENIFVGNFGEVLVLDWGLVRNLRDFKGKHRAKTKIECEKTSDSSKSKYDKVKITLDDSQDPELTVEGYISGTPYYMSPEQMAGNNNKIDHRSDIYTLGVILYQILTLELPFKAGNIQELMNAVISGKYLTPRKAASGRKIPKELEAITNKAMSFNPDNRYQNVEELHKDIQNYFDDFPLMAMRYSPLSRFWKLCLRHKILSVSITAVMLTSTLAYSAHQIELNIRYNALYDSANRRIEASVNRFRIANTLLDESNKKHEDPSSQTEQYSDCDNLATQCKTLEKKAEHDAKIAIALLDDIPEKFKKSSKIQQAYIRIFKERIAHCIKNKNTLQAEDCLKQLEACLDMDKSIPNANKRKQIEKLRKLLKKDD